MKTAPILLATTIIAVITVGCGGNGSSTTGATNSGMTNATGGVTSAPPNALRQNVSGDRYVYTVSGTYIASGSTSSLAAFGSAAEGFQTETYNGVSALGDALGLQLQVAANSYSFTDTKVLTTGGLTVAQSDDGAANSGVPILATSNAFSLPTSLSQGYAFSGTEGLLSGTSVHVTEGVTGFQSMTTAAGTFICWTLSKTSTWSDGLTQTETIQFSPVLGAAVQRVVTATQLNGYSYTVTETLASYTFGNTPG